MRAYQRLMALAKSRGHYKTVEARKVIPAPTKLLFYRGRLAHIQRKILYYRPIKLNYKQIQLVGELRMFEDELKRRIAQCKI